MFSCAPSGSDLQHDHTRMADKADGSIVLAQQQMGEDNSAGDSERSKKVRKIEEEMAR